MGSGLDHHQPMYRDKRLAAGKFTGSRQFDKADDYCTRRRAGGLSKILFGGMARIRDGVA
jgi:hypothetical protein